MKTARMGETGYRRLNERYTLGHMREAYALLYKELAERNGTTWPE
jgi:hypothetical protein